jgi:hypothetical protein
VGWGVNKQWRWNVQISTVNDELKTNGAGDIIALGPGLRLGRSQWPLSRPSASTVSLLSWFQSLVVVLGKLHVFMTTAELKADTIGKSLAFSRGSITLGFTCRTHTPLKLTISLTTRPGDRCRCMMPQITHSSVFSAYWGQGSQVWLCRFGDAASPFKACPRLWCPDWFD